LNEEKVMVEILLKMGRLEATVDDLKIKVEELELSIENNKNNQRVSDAPNKESFITELENQLSLARDEGKNSVKINAGELHRAVGSYPGPSHRMPSCVSVMRSFIDKYNGKIIDSPESGMGARFTVEYLLENITED